MVVMQQQLIRLMLMFDDCMCHILETGSDTDYFQQCPKHMEIQSICHLAPHNILGGVSHYVVLQWVQWVNDEENTNLKNKKLFVDQVSDHGCIFFFIVWNVISLDVHLHLLLFQIEHELELLRVVLPAQWTFKKSPSEQIK